MACGLRFFGLVDVVVVEVGFLLGWFNIKKNAEKKTPSSYVLNAVNFERFSLDFCVMVFC